MGLVTLARCLRGLVQRGAAFVHDAELRLRGRVWQLAKGAATAEKQVARRHEICYSYGVNTAQELRLSST